MGTTLLRASAYFPLNMAAMTSQRATSTARWAGSTLPGGHARGHARSNLGSESKNVLEKAPELLSN